MLEVDIHISLLRPEALYGVARRSPGLVADEQHVVSRVAEHGLEVVDDTAAGAHAVASDDDGGSGAACQG
ncbi:hypothetical protein RU08_11660 [Pseudomonas fulva]|uniref:Uncharacterized protein n=1 Tax=Pseudomonas fulva TaxID=47880 RepID=A0A0D0KSV1_9PSED|nr:hypothetical protein RU08_11660 [Pseudomonas fulva]